MNIKTNKIEILAPAGSYESMKAAIHAGADAVYIGGNKFGARAYADNPDEELLLRAIDFAHLHGRRLYLTVNTLIKEEEMGDLYSYLSPLYQQGLDAVIVQDMGALHYIKNTFPGLDIHASTQMTVTGAYGVNLLKEYGVTRVVMPRELSIQEIRQIHQSTDIEIEAFVHGALCYSYSGQCLYSSLVGGRSGNRGRCAQPCRLPYTVYHNDEIQSKKEESYVLSLKDLCTLDQLPQLVEAGIYSMKIEGRMKSPRYTAGVVSIYRKYMDYYLTHGSSGYSVSEGDKKLLLDLFDRGGFTEGYFDRHNGKSMIALREKPAFREGNQELFHYLDQTYINCEQKERINGKVRLSKDLPATIRLNCGEHRILMAGQVPMEAKNQSLTEESVRKQIEKTGNTPFVFETLEIQVDEGLFIPVKDLNELRREGLLKLEDTMLRSYKRDFVEEPKKINREKHKSKKELFVSVLLDNPIHFDGILSFPEVSIIELDSNGFLAEAWIGVVEKSHEASKKCYLVLPHIFRTEALEYFKQESKRLVQAGFDGFLVRNLEELEFLRALPLSGELIVDYNLYTLNHESQEFFAEAGVARNTVPVELNYKELRRHDCTGSELIVYGYLPMMITAQCIQKTTMGCGKDNRELRLKDRKGIEFSVRSQCQFCYNIIYNSSPLSLLDNRDQIQKLNPESVRLQFSSESEAEVLRIMRVFIENWLYNKETEFGIENFTRGHFKRGVE